MSIASDDQASFWSRPDLQSRRSVDLLCRQFEDWWHSQQRVTIESLLVEADTSIRDELTHELIAIEWELRQGNGESPTRMDYVTRFPSINELMDELESPSQSNGSPDVSSPVDTRVFNPGTVFSSFRIVRELGRGAMGIVYLAEIPAIGHQIALKILNSSYAEDPLVATRFEREARLLSQLDHPGIVPLYSYGEDNGHRYLVMKAVPGVSLADILFGHSPSGDLTETLRSTKSVSRPEVIRSIAVQLTEALHFVHQAGILHRDVKPSNVLVTECGKVFLSDFSLARTELVDSDLTSQHEFIGTLRYAAPESLDGVWSVQTDLHSLGLVLLELYSLSPSFAARTRRELLQQKLDALTLKRTIEASAIPAPFQRVIEKLTTSDPAKQYPSAKEVLTDLKSLDLNRPSKTPEGTPRLFTTGVTVLVIAVLAVAWSVRNTFHKGSDSPADLTSAVGAIPQPEHVLRVRETYGVALNVAQPAEFLTIADNGEIILFAIPGALYRWSPQLPRPMELEHPVKGRVLTADISPYDDIAFCTEEPQANESGPGSEKSYGMAANMPEEGGRWFGFGISSLDLGFSDARFVRGGPATERGIILIPSSHFPAILNMPAHKITNLPWQRSQVTLAAAWEKSLAVVLSNNNWMLTSLSEPGVDVPAFPAEVQNPVGLHFVNDGQYVMICSEKDFNLFAAEKQEKVTNQPLPSGTRPVVSTPHEGPWLACLGPRAVHVFDMDLRQWLPTIVETQGEILLAATLPKERAILTVEKTGRICLTELLPSGTRVLHESITSPLALSAYSIHGRRFVVIDTTGTLRVFQLEQ